MLFCRNCTPLLYFDWLFRFWIYFDSPAHLISWYAAAGFFFGGALFIIGSFTSVAPAVRHCLLSILFVHEHCLLMCLQESKQP